MPAFKLSGTNGKTYTQATLSSRPTVIVFLSKGCPHNPKAMVDLNRLAAQLGKGVQFVGVTNATPADTLVLAKTLKASFPILADPKGTMISAYGATHSLDTVLICSHDKAIAKLWEGYNRTMIAELVKMLPGHGGPKLTLDLSAYPSNRQSGCGF